MQPTNINLPVKPDTVNRPDKKTSPNYMDIIRWFWDEVPQMDGFKPEYIALFFALIDSINRNKWQEVSIEYDRIIYKTGIGKRMYLSGRNWLHNNGIILCTPGRGDYAKARFSMGDAVQYAVSSAVQKCTASRTLPAPHTAPHDAPINNKQLRPLRQLDYYVEDEVEIEKPVEEKQTPAEAKKETAYENERLQTPTELRQELSEDTAAKAAYRENHGLDEKQFNQALITFCNNLTAERKRKTQGDFRRHFNFWLGKQADEFKRPPAASQTPIVRPKNTSSTFKSYD